VESLYKYNPGVKVRLAQGLIDMVHENLLEYGNSYLNFDYAFEKAGEYKFNHFPLFIHFKYSNLRHDPISFNMSNAALQFLSPDMSDDAQVLRVVLPLVKYFEADFDYEYTFLGMLQKGHLQIVADNTFAVAEFALSTTSKGHIYP
jgi:hypothetical protein